MEQTFLGHTLTTQDVLSLQEKVTAIQDFPQPSTKHKVTEFLGLVNFYHRCILHCSNHRDGK